MGCSHFVNTVIVLAQIDPCFLKGRVASLLFFSFKKIVINVWPCCKNHLLNDNLFVSLFNSSIFLWKLISFTLLH